MTMLPAFASTGIASGCFLKLADIEWLYIVMGESPLTMHMGNDPWAAVLAIYIDQRDPAG